MVGHTYHVARRVSRADSRAFAETSSRWLATSCFLEHTPRNHHAIPWVYEFACFRRLIWVESCIFLWWAYVLLSTISSGFIHVIAELHNVLLSYGWTVLWCLPLPHFLCSSLDGHLGCFHVQRIFYVSPKCNGEWLDSFGKVGWQWSNLYLRESLWWLWGKVIGRKQEWKLKVKLGVYFRERWQLELGRPQWARQIGGRFGSLTGLGDRLDGELGE